MLGCLLDPARPSLVFEWGSRGSLMDVLVQDDIKLDWSFRLSLLTDLVRVSSCQRNRPTEYEVVHSLTEH